MSYHPFPLYIPMAGDVGGPPMSTEQICRIADMKSFTEMNARLRYRIERFNNSICLAERKREIEQLRFWKGICFPEIGEVLSPSRIGFDKQTKQTLPQRFIVMDSEIVIERINDLSESGYEVVVRFPLDAIVLDLRIERDAEKLENGRTHEFIVSATWKTGSIESVAFDSAQL